MAIWDPYLSERDKEHVRLWGKKEPTGFGKRPALLVIDDYYSVLGLDREPIFESMKKWPGSCGLEGWEAIDKTVDLIAAARENGIPIFYVHGMDDPIGPWGSRIDSPPRKRMGLDHLSPEEKVKANEIVAEVAPEPGDFVFQKAAASAFHGTPLVFQLNYLNIDTIIACGETTSGCVRASVVDGATFRFKMGVVADCCFDRTEASHAINLFDMHHKYADVVDLQAAIEYFASVGAKEKELVGV